MKKYKIVISKDAREDIEDAFKYISDILFEPDIAKRIQRTLLIRIKSLETMPKRNAVIDMEPYKTRGVRMLLIENYNTFLLPRKGWRVGLERQIENIQYRRLGIGAWLTMRKENVFVPSINTD